MNEVFKTTLSLSCSGALLIVVFRLLRPLVSMRLSKRWQYYIWLVVVARLLIPLAPEANLMGLLFEQISQGIPQAKSNFLVDQNEPSGESHASIQYGDSGQDRAPADLLRDKADQSGRIGGDSVTGRINAGLGQVSVLLQYIWILWSATALVLLIRKATIYQSFVKYIRAGCVDVEEIELLEQFGRLVAQSGVKSAVDLSTNPLISSPLLMGFFRPCIVLPTTKISDSDFQFTILHELSHFKRCDMFYKWLIQVTICIHWFNPFVYLMEREVERTCELACDEAVIWKLDGQGRRAYGNTLMNAIGAGGRYKNSVAAVTLCESKELLRERLGAITFFRKQSKLVRTGSVVLTVAVCLGAVSVGAYSAPAPGTMPQTSGDLTLATVEYTVGELIESEVTGINVQTLSDEITVLRGGDTVKFEYYAANPGEYSLNQSKDVTPLEEIKDRYGVSLGNTLSLLRIQGDSQAVEGERSITITVPKEYSPEYLTLVNLTGDIRLEDCSFPNVSIETQTGAIDMVGGDIGKNLSIWTESGDALISQTVLPVRDKGKTIIETRIGFITFQPLDSPLNYQIDIDYGDEANVMINQEYVEKSQLLEEHVITNPDDSTSYPSEGVKRINQFSIQKNGASVIHFTSPKGTLRLLGK